MCAVETIETLLKHDILTMSVALAVHPSLLALAVVTLAVGALHNASSTTGVVTMSMPMPVPMAMARISHAAARLVHEHNSKDGKCNEGGGCGAEELVECRHVVALFVLWEDVVVVIVVCWLRRMSELVSPQTPRPFYSDFASPSKQGYQGMQNTFLRVIVVIYLHDKKTVDWKIVRQDKVSGLRGD